MVDMQGRGGGNLCPLGGHVFENDVGLTLIN